MTTPKSKGPLWARVQDKLQKLSETSEYLLSDCRSVLEEAQALIIEFIPNEDQLLRIDMLDWFAKHLLKQRKPQLSKNQEIRIHLWLGRRFETLGALDRSLKIYRRVLKISDSDEFASAKAEALRWIGHIYLQKNRWKQSLELYKLSLNLCLSYGDREGEAYSYSALGSLYFEKGEYDSALLEWERALELAENLDEERLTAKFCTNLGALANVRGDWEKALYYYQKSIPRYERIGESRGLAATYHNIAMTYADAKRWADADEHYDKSYQLAKDIGDIHTQATIKLNRVELHLSVGELDVARALCLQAQKTFVQLGDRLGEAEVFKFLGMIFSRQKQWSEAKVHFQNSIRLTRKLKHPLGEAESHLEYARMLKKKNSLNASNKEYNLALDLFTKLQIKNEITTVKQELAELR